MEDQSTSGTPPPATGGARGVDGKAAGAKPSRLKRWRNNLILLSVSTLIALILGEVVLRWAIFSTSPEKFKNLKDPGHYFYAWDAGYWKMLYLSDTVNHPPRKPHPYLGWLQDVNGETYYHAEAPKVGRRRPVLLYGDSFSACIDSVQCFEDILNADPAFSAQNFLLNYGIGGYGVCQSSLLCRKTAPHYQKPLVVFGLLTTDLDRTVLPVRVGQKPYYDIEEGSLALKGYPIDPVPAHYFEENPIGFTSYLFRYFIHSRFNIVPYRIKTWYDGKEKSIAHIKDVNRLLIGQLAQELRAKGLDFVFLVFHFEDDMMSPNSEENWYDQFLKQTMAENNIPYIWSKGVIRAHRLAHPENAHTDYIIPGNGHPTTLYNRLIAAEIQRVAQEHTVQEPLVLDSLNDELFEARVWARARAIERDSSMMAMIRSKASENGVSIDAQIQADARYLMNLELTKEHPFKPDGVFEGKWPHR